MAQQKNRQSKNTPKRTIKPEEVLVVRPKQKTVIRTTKKVAPPKKKRPKLRIKKYANMRVRQPVFKLIVVAFLCVAVAVAWFFVSESLRETNRSLDASAKAANGMFVAAKAEADLVRIIGTKTQRANEIINYQSAPKDLQSFVMSDYRTFKKQCIANGKLSNDISYELNNVIYDEFAVAKRTCNGTDTAIFKKFDGKWALVFSGNVLPKCSLVNDLNIPQGATMYCSQDDIRYLNPNP